MIPLPYGIALSPRLLAELVLVVLLIVACGTAYTYRALYQHSKARVTEQLSAVREATAQQTAKAWAAAYAEREAQMLRDQATARQAAQDAVTRARRAESALDKMQRDRNAEAKDTPCLDADLSPRTRERLRQLEADYRAGAGPAAGTGARPQ